MVENGLLLLQLLIYIFLIPIVFKALMSIDIDKMVKNYKVNQVRALYILITLVIVKVVGDLLFFLVTLGPKISGLL